MNVVYCKCVSRFILFTAFVFALSGCGSSDGSNQSTATGSIAAKLLWGSSSKNGTTAKTLYAVPAGVVTVKIIVSASGMETISKDFAASDGSGTIDGIPVGTGRLVKVQGLDSGGIIRYQGQKSDILIESGKVTPVGVITMTAPATTASPVGGSYLSAQNVTLTAVTASEPATIYYTTNGLEPSTSSTTKGLSPLVLNISTNTTLKFFAVDSGFAQEATKTENYTITTGSLTVTF